MPSGVTATAIGKDPTGMGVPAVLVAVLIGVTVLLFTEGKTFVTLEFDGPSYALAPPEFVTEVGQKQDDAVKKGLGG